MTIVDAITRKRTPPSKDYFVTASFSFPPRTQYSIVLGNSQPPGFMPARCAGISLQPAAGLAGAGGDSEGCFRQAFAETSSRNLGCFWEVNPGSKTFLALLKPVLPGNPHQGQERDPELEMDSGEPLASARGALLLTQPAATETMTGWRVHLSGPGRQQRCQR